MQINGWTWLARNHRCDHENDGRRQRAQLLMLGTVIALSGCAPSTDVGELKFNVDRTASAAMATYDLDGNGELTSDELESCPSLAARISNSDADQSGTLSQNEIASRLTAILDRNTTYINASCGVFFRNQPLANALVRLVPEPFLEEALETAEGRTDEFGNASLTTPAGYGSNPGFFRVEVTHPDRDLPAKYNTQTTLGCEIAPDVRDGNRFQLDLK